MLKECKRAMFISGSLDDGEIARLCMAGAMDLNTRGVILPGTVEFIYNEIPIIDEDTGETEVDPRTGEARFTESVFDNSTLEDDFCMRAIITYVKANFGNPPNRDWLIRSYETQLAQLMVTSGYTDYSMVEPAAEEPEEDEEGISE